MNKTTFTYKGYGRIYVHNPADVNTVDEIIKKMDEYEYGYMPAKLIAPFSEYPAVTYLHKFNDLNLDELMVQCWDRGIHIWCFDSGREEYPNNVRLKEV